MDIENNGKKYFDEVIIWGAGKRGKKAIEYFGEMGIKVIAVIDSDVNKQGKFFEGIRIIDIKEYLNEGLNFPIIVTPIQNDDIVKILHRYGVKDYYRLDDFFIEFRQIIPDKCMFSKKGNFVKNFFLKTIKKWRDNIILGRSDYSMSPGELINKSKCIIQNENMDTVRHTYELLFCGKINNKNNEFDCMVLHGIRDTFLDCKMAIDAITKQKNLIYSEDGFIRSILPVGRELELNRFMDGHSITLDYNGPYINAKSSTYLEYLINSDRAVEPKQIDRCKKLIDYIRKNKISKYNCQPDIPIMIGKIGRKKILVIDQVVGDRSIDFGLASDATFDKMLNCAISENPGADIIIKTHPQTNLGHYHEINSVEDVFFIDYGINPITLLEYVDKVYVCTSQMGFEALMCGKEVHVFGMPFYAGWGVTHDRQKCKRRTNKRSIEEIFYFAYIEYSYYVSYKTGKVCNIEECIDEILDLRSEYFNICK